MENEINQEIIEDDRTPMVVLARDRNPHFGDCNPNLVGRLIYGNPLTNGSWSPYIIDPYRTQGEVGLDSSATIRILDRIDEVISNLAEGQKLPFVLANGHFPRGCGNSPFAPCLIVGREQNSFEDILSETINYLSYDAALERRAAGRMNLERSGDFESQLRINEFSSRYFENLKDYADTITAVSGSFLAPEGTPILFRANLGGSKK